MQASPPETQHSRIIISPMLGIRRPLPLIKLVHLPTQFVPPIKQPAPLIIRLLLFLPQDVQLFFQGVPPGLGGFGLRVIEDLSEGFDLLFILGDRGLERFQGGHLFRRSFQRGDLVQGLLLIDKLEFARLDLSVKLLDTGLDLRRVLVRQFLPNSGDLFGLGVDRVLMTFDGVEGLAPVRLLYIALYRIVGIVGDDEGSKDRDRWDRGDHGWMPRSHDSIVASEWEEIKKKRNKDGKKTQKSDNKISPPAFSVRIMINPALSDYNSL